MKKRLISLILAAVMALISAMLPFSAFAGDEPFLSTDNNGNTIYNRVSNGKHIEFNTDFYQMIKYISDAIENHETNIEYRFATTDTTYFYDTEGDSSLSTSGVSGAKAACEKLYQDIYKYVFGIETVAGVPTSTTSSVGGEYLYKSMKSPLPPTNTNSRVSYYGSTFDNNNPATMARYSTFSIKFENLSYYTTLEQERYTKSFVEWFSSYYLNSNMTEYQKVKTIYDFIVRNATYDEFVYTNGYNGQYTVTQTRYDIAHSAFGAIYGSSDMLGKVYDGTVLANMPQYFGYESSVTNEPILKSSDNGRSVCEGNAKLFYYLCMYNGIECHIVDGDYIAESEKNSDPHEWNYVKLDDESGDGYKWFQVDCTRGAQNSQKDINFNNYNYFLSGEESVYFGYKNHQQAYFNKGVNDNKYQLYDWYLPEHRSSHKNYQFKQAVFYKDKLTHGYILRRLTDSGDGKEYEVYLQCDANGHMVNNVDADPTPGYETGVDGGFIYNGKDSKYEAFLPYVVSRTNTITTDTGEKVVIPEGEYVPPEKVKNTDTGVESETAKAIGNYRLEFSDNFAVSFKILPRDMSTDSLAGNVILVTPEGTNYTGNDVKPTVTVTDAKGNDVLVNRDYVLYFTRNGTRVNEIRDIGDYVIHLEFSGNYTGTYTFNFKVDVVDLNKIKYESGTKSFPYYPKYGRDQNGLTNPVNYYNNASPLSIGEIKFINGFNVDITSTNSSMEYGSTGKLVLKGRPNNNVKENSTLEIDYAIDQRFDINQLNINGKVAETGGTNPVYYTGSEVRPTKFDVLDVFLEQGKDYRIVSYSNNVGSSSSTTVGYVTIEGINGCYGTATMQFPIYPASANPSGGGSSGGSSSSGGRSSSSSSGGTRPSSSGNGVYLPTKQFTYTGGSIQPSFTFTNSSGNSISTNYYYVSYASNVNVGTGYIVINMRGGYDGAFKVAFEILPKGTKLSSVKAAKKSATVKWKKQAAQTSGYQIQYATSSKFKGAKTVTVSKNKTTSKKITKLKSKKKYYFRIRTYKKVGSQKYYSSWSKAKSVKIK
ncbi:MAG: fibronectin type III domain-containing protein [Eubacterium sp.]|nr:fibronectin type III domain-containing protein [Eubacterium sp.]